MKNLAPVLFTFLLIRCGAPSPDIPERDVLEWNSVESDLQSQLITASDSAVIDLPAGHFMFSRSLLIDGKKHLTLRGAGMDQTILSFAAQEEGAEGIKAANCVNLTLEGFTIEDAKGDNIKVTDSRGVVLRDVKSQWNGEPKMENGAYAFYPVLSKNVLIENCVAIGSSDAGIYVGQSDSVVIRRNEAYYNVAGIESENSKWVDIYDNYAHHNTGGILVFDLPGLTQYGHTTRVFGNRIESNNYTNFAPKGNVVATVPPGTGLMLLATRNIEIYENLIKDNQSVGTAIISYDIVEALSTTEESQLNENIEKAQKDVNYDPYPNDVYIHDNIFDNGHLIPTTENDFGLLFMTKFPLNTPDIVWDGIKPEGTDFRLCVSESEGVKFANLDAANDFENLQTGLGAYKCKGDQVVLELSL